MSGHSAAILEKLQKAQGEQISIKMNGDVV